MTQEVKELLLKVLQFLCGFFGMHKWVTYTKGQMCKRCGKKRFEDKWYYQDQIYSGKVVMKAPLEGMPVYFIKAGSVIPAEEDEIVFHIYPLDDGKYCYTYYEEDKKRVISVTCTKTEIKINGVDINKIVIHDSYSRNVNIC